MPNERVLIVDDEQSISLFLNLTLTSQGYETIEAVSGKEALTKAAAQKPDIVILDLGLPDIDGTEVTRLLREWTQIPIIILSVRGSEKDKIAALGPWCRRLFNQTFCCWRTAGPCSCRLKAVRQDNRRTIF